MDSHCTTPTPKETQYDAMRIRNGVRHGMLLMSNARAIAPQSGEHAQQSGDAHERGVEVDAELQPSRDGQDYAGHR